MSVVPAVIPVITPIDEMEAIVVSKTDHIPPGVASLNVIVAFAHINGKPVIIAGNAFTVIGYCIMQVVPKA